MKTLITMNRQGRITIPLPARRALRMEDEAQFEMEVTEDALILRPAIVIPREEAWAYTSEHREAVREALEQTAEGQVYRMTEGGIKELIRRAHFAREGGRDFRATAAELDELGERVSPAEPGK